MKKTNLLLIALIFIVIGGKAQTPNQFKYQAVLRNAEGTILANENVNVDISILQGSTTGTEVFTESHSVTTTEQGLINLNIGSFFDLSIVDWAGDICFIEISVNGIVMGTSQLLSVPYALQAKEVENVDYSQITNMPTIPTDVSELSDNTFLLFDGDYNSLTNLPTLFDGNWSSIIGTPPNVSIFNNDAAYLTSYTETDPIFGVWDKSSGISITESQISDLGTYLTTEVDGSVSNEIQTISLSGSTLTISGGNSVELPVSNSGSTPTTLLYLSNGF